MKAELIRGLAYCERQGASYLVGMSLGWCILSGTLPRMYAAENAGIVEAPLSARSGPRGSTLFKLMDPAQTGILTENHFADPKMWEDRE